MHTYIITVVTTTIERSMQWFSSKLGALSCEDGVWGGEEPQPPRVLMLFVF